MSEHEYLSIYDHTEGLFTKQTLFDCKHCSIFKKKKVTLVVPQFRGNHTGCMHSAV